MNCLLVVNTLSGNASKVNEDELIRKYAEGDSVSVQYIKDPSDSYSVEGVDKLIVCGGDGTLNHALNLCRDKEMDVLYLPFGTFNEAANGRAGSGVKELAMLGRIQNTDFAYVAAAGSFTGIGQAPSAKSKRRFKILAYFSKVLSSYKVHRIEARISSDKINETGVYTLIMLSNARRCFGFRFNKLYRDNSEELQLIAIKAPKKDNLIGRIRMFFPFFRVFFLGFSKEKIGKTISFVSLKKAEITLSSPVSFCIDGEYKKLSGSLSVRKEAHKARVRIIKD